MVADCSRRLPCSDRSPGRLAVAGNVALRRVALWGRETEAPADRSCFEIRDDPEAFFGAFRIAGLYEGPNFDFRLPS